MLFKKTYKLATMLAVMGALTGHAASDIDLNSIGYFSFTPLPAELQAQKDTLLLSDSPEYVGPVGGVLSAGSINGKGRIYFYHVKKWLNLIRLPLSWRIPVMNQMALPCSVN